MLIDWFTTGAQLVNFLILLLLLRRFLYKPVLAAMAAREKAVADSLTAAETAKEEAAIERRAWQEKNSLWEEEQAERLRQAKELAEKEYQARRETLRREIQDQEDAWHRKVAQEKDAFLAALARQAQAEVFAAARQLLADLADAELEGQMALVFSRKLQALPPPQKESLAACLRASPAPLVLTSGFAWPAERQEALRDMLRREFPAATGVAFLVEPKLIGGVELSAGGQKISWTVSAYLESLQRTTAQLLERKMEHDTHRG